MLLGEYWSCQMITLVTSLFIRNARSGLIRVSKEILSDFVP